MSSQQRVDAVQSRVDEVRRRLQNLNTTFAASNVIVAEDAKASSYSNLGLYDQTANYPLGTNPLTSSGVSASAAPSLPNSGLITLKEQYNTNQQYQHPQHQRGGQSLFQPVTTSSTFDEVRGRLNHLKMSNSTLSASDQQQQQQQQQASVGGSVSRKENNKNTSAKEEENAGPTSFNSIQARISAIANRLHDVASTNSEKQETYFREAAAEVEAQQKYQQQEEENDNRTTTEMLMSNNNRARSPSNNNNNSSRPPSTKRNNNQQGGGRGTSTSISPSRRESSSLSGTSPILTSEKLVKGMFTPKSRHYSAASSYNATPPLSNAGSRSGSTINNNSNNNQNVNSNNTSVPVSIAAGPQSTRLDPNSKSALKFASSSPAAASVAKGEEGNPQATLVSGAELFAILRLRGFITTHGNSGEHSLPVTAVHKILLTPSEISQLNALRKSLANSTSTGAGERKSRNSSPALPSQDPAPWLRNQQQQQQQQQPVQDNNNQQQQQHSNSVRWR